ncbi:MAG: hypothetical protein GY714_14225 [Desulfobacterales bacterium]|nr:hypothetical protein [Desulfobacterales bacterium]
MEGAVDGLFDGGLEGAVDGLFDGGLEGAVDALLDRVWGEARWTLTAEKNTPKTKQKKIHLFFATSGGIQSRNISSNPYLNFFYHFNFILRVFFHAPGEGRVLKHAPIDCNVHSPLPLPAAPTQ